ncbi:Cytosine deaminase or related metal-dependent hydrolase [Halalkaliarchaeum sp. AArc-CO]|nr:Cytosine deaminase or related metal-dependent hydrolase [Halalkaliarchaeum sp. AArc-CO]
MASGMNTLCVSGGTVLRPDQEVEPADVLIDREEGTILEVGTELAADATETLDASGCVVIPGLVNAHTHVAMTLLRGYADDKPLETWLREDVWPIEGAFEPADVEAGAELGVLEMIRSGTTAFADMYFHVDRIANVVERSGLRARLGHGIVTVGKDESEALADLEESVDIARELDGTADGRIRSMVAPHSLTTVGEEHLQEAFSAAREIDVPVHLHANETTDEVEPIVEDRGMRPLEYARELGLAAEDFLAHGVHVDDREIELLSESGTGVIHCPASNMKLASGMAPVEKLLQAGVTVGLGTDGAASNNDLDMFDEIRDAAMIGKLAAADASAVAAGSAVRMATAGGADAVGLPGGRIEPGAAADLAVVDFEAPHLTPRHDVVSHLAYAARGSDVRHTVCDGQVLMRDREVLVLDEEAVRERASRRAEVAIDRAHE